MKKKTKIFLIIVGLFLIYVLFFPMPSPEMAVRKYLLITNPVVALTGKVDEGKVNNDPKYGDLYFVYEVEKPFIYVKKNAMGWSVTSSGTGP
ncbi:hypothetical protein [Paenibacillus wynnii]|uniref:Uncharacterized protein n=1 Tax=Paenibacillus wynnii TaxID=268407 RepID=A0A098M462_9BACL|nr:hypothetical protein [Paenibacillus wynnii]KGE16841.1 hypothetical protein PWYN_19350 [Paenibacillus wynnii]